jgi:hypothetical protein
MAQEVIINVQASTAEANKNLEKLNATILEQKEILVELERELYKVESAQKETSKTSLSAQKALRDEAQHLTSSIQDQRLSLKELNVQQQNTKAALDSVNVSSQQVAGSFGDVASNGGAMAILDTLTGGLATRMRDAFEATKLFNVSLKATKTALIATGIGALVVALGTIIAYWDDIVGFITNANNKLEDQIALNKRNITQIDHEIGLLELQKGILEANGESTAATNKKIEEAILLRQEENRILTDNLRKQLEAERAEINKVTFLEEAEISLYRSLGLYEKMAAAQAASLVGTKEQNEELNAIDAQVKESEKKQLEFELKLANLRKTERDKEKEKEEEKNKLDLEANDLKLKKAQELADLEKEIRDAEANTVAEQRIKELEDLQLHYDALILKAQENQIATDELEKSKNESLLQLQADFDQQDIDAAKKKSDELDAIAEKQKNDAIKKKQAEISGKEALEQSYINTVSGFSNLLGQIAGENKQMQIASIIISQAANIAKIISNTTAANARALIELGPVAGAAAGVRQRISAGIGIASSVAAGAKAISQIKAADKGGSTVSDNGGSMPPAITAPSAPPSFNVVGASNSSQLAGVIANQSQQPIQAYVVSNDVTTAQSLDRNIIESVGI